MQAAPVVMSDLATLAKTILRLTCSAARSICSWPMWLELKEATRSSTEMLMTAERRMGRAMEMEV